mmetsp:Transcript_19096/g.56790  ORF Transcript_19096/g.56790 Transcript_19096/m.56790 type:complete len:412 (-) Transcript_19096:184-1419(-)
MNLVAYSDSSSDEGGTVGRRGSGEDSRQDSPTGKLNAAAHVRAKRAAGTAPGPPAARPRLVLPGAGALLSGSAQGDDAVEAAAAAASCVSTGSGGRDGSGDDLSWKRPDALGRVRTFKRDHASWPSAVMIPAEFSEAQLQLLREAIEQVRRLVPGVHAIGAAGAQEAPPAAGSSSSAAQHLSVGAPAAAGSAARQTTTPGEQVARNAPATREVLHLSLSRVQPLRFHLRDSLLEELRAAMAPFQSASLELLGLRVFCNDERTRTFVALLLPPNGTAYRAVVRMIGAVNKAFMMHGLKVFYQDPQPHVSFAWVAGDHQAALEAALQQLQVPTPAAACPPTWLPTCGSLELAHSETSDAQGAGSDAAMDEHPPSVGRLQGVTALWQLPLTLRIERVVARVGIQDHDLWELPGS